MTFSDVTLLLSKSDHSSKRITETDVYIQEKCATLLVLEPAIHKNVEQALYHWIIHQPYFLLGNWS